MHYTLGFYIYNDMVALVRKCKPAWQCGKLNGIGGKVENGENEWQAQRREFREETGLDIENWFHFTTMRGKDWTVYCFVTQVVNPDEEAPPAIQGSAEEPVQWFFIDEVLRGNEIIPNLRWLLPMAMDAEVLGSEVYCK